MQGLKIVDESTSNVEDVDLNRALLSSCLGAIIFGALIGFAAGWIFIDTALGAASHFMAALGYAAIGGGAGLMLILIYDVLVGGRLDVNQPAFQTDEIEAKEEQALAELAQTPKAARAESTATANSLLDKKVS